jgi:hypothetical protein
MAPRVLNSLRVWWSVVTDVARTRKRGGTAPAAPIRSGPETPLPDLDELEGEIARLKADLRRLQARTPKSGDRLTIDRLAARVSDLEQSYKAAQAQRSEDAKALVESAWKTKALGAEVQKLMAYSSTLRKDVQTFITELEKIPISERAARLKADTEELLQKHMAQTKAMIREGKKHLSL